MGTHARVAQLRWNVLPAAATDQDKPQDGEHRAVLDARSATHGTDLQIRWQVMHSDIKERVGQASKSHHRSFLPRKGILSDVQFPCPGLC
jgi:hypothetical protein